MKYLMLIYGNEEKWASFPAETWPEAIAKQDALEIAADMPFGDQEPVELWPVPHDSKADL